MDPFDERILTVLGDGKPRGFHQLLGEAGFSHNTLRLHLERLVDKGLVLKQKMPKNGLGRPRFSYSLPPRLKHHISLILSEPSIEVVSLPFSRLRHLYRFEKGGYCKKIKGACKPQNCPQIPKQE